MCWLTGNEWRSVQLLEPGLGELDGLESVVLSCHRVALLVCVRDQPGHILGIDRVHDVEEILPRGEPVLRQLVGEVLREGRRMLQLGP